MASHTITAMFGTRAEADRAAASIRENSALSASNVKVLPEEGEPPAASGNVKSAGESVGLMASLRNFFMPEEDRYAYAEGIRRGGYMVAADTDEAHTHQVMDVLEQAGAVDLDAQESKWRQEGWQGYEPSTTATTGAPSHTTSSGLSSAGDLAAATNADPMPVTPGAQTAGTHVSGTATGTAAGTATGTGTEESIPLVEETLRVGKRLVTEGRVRIRSYVVETPVTETVHLREEHVQVERRPVDRPVTPGDANLFREREIEATETREEPVVAKDARVREELVMRRTAEERDETVSDTVRHTEVKEDRDEPTTRDPSSTPSP